MVRISKNWLEHPSEISRVILIVAPVYVFSMYVVCWFSALPLHAHMFCKIVRSSSTFVFSFKYVYSAISLNLLLQVWHFLSGKNYKKFYNFVFLFVESVFLSLAKITLGHFLFL